MDLNAPSNPPETVVFVLVPNFSMLAFTSAIEPLRIANRLREHDLYRWTTASKDGAPVRAANGVEVAAEIALDEVDFGGRAPLVLVCSDLEAERIRDDELFVWLRQAARHGAMLGGLCTGTYLLARAGLIDDRKCAIHWEALTAFVAEFPEITVAADLYQIDRGRLTCSGGTAALDMMLTRIALDHGNELATKVSEQCVLDRIRSPDDRQHLPIRARLGVHHPKVILALELMEANVDAPLGHEVLAAYVGLSRRQLERLFKQHVGRSPAHYYLELRLERARNLIYQTDMAIMDVARSCGFVSASHFATAYRQLYGKTPREERHGSNSAS
ncbi:MAG: GlxA family transcriptional regulator [Geminicoccaceae bacterium]|nr:MAG: GlxA family transcriptional regulator [Geminicoccaceae bacterium]